MARDLDPALVEARLAKLRELFVPETIAEARARLRTEALAPDVLAARVAQRLEELRALVELTRYLHAHAATSRSAR